MASGLSEKEMQNTLLSLFELERYLYVLIIDSCNGRRRVSFSNASIFVDVSKVNYQIATWFSQGIEKIFDAIPMNGERDSTGCSKAFENLLNVVFKEKKHEKCLKKLIESDKKSEAKIRNTLAAHYFLPLAQGSECYVDKGSSVPSVCEFCKKAVHVGNTSLGSLKVWHGTADIIIKAAIVKIEESSRDEDNNGDDEESPRKQNFVRGDPEDPRFYSITEVKKDKMNVVALSQSIAEAIVNAFCEVKKNKSLSKKFIPSFVATDRYVRIILYSCERDILLVSDELKIWNSDKLNIPTMLLVWLAINMENIEDEEVLVEIESSNFKEAVGSAYPVYEREVNKPMASEKVDCNQAAMDFDVLMELKSKNIQRRTQSYGQIRKKLKMRKMKIQEEMEIEEKLSKEKQSNS